MARRAWRELLVGVVIGSIGFAGGCGGSSDSQASPPPKGVHDAIKKSMKEYMEQQKQKNMTKGQPSR
jgi:hypothetical protein